MIEQGSGNCACQLRHAGDSCFCPPITAAEYNIPVSGKERYPIASQRSMDRIAALRLPVYPVI